MTCDTKKDLLVLSAGIFPDAVTVKAALQQFSNQERIRHYDIDPKTMQDGDWDELLQLIQQAASVITL